MHTMLKGQLRIGASDTICRYFLIDYFQKYHQNYPDVRIKITNSTSIGCVDLLEKGQVDLDCLQLSQLPAGKSHECPSPERIP